MPARARDLRGASVLCEREREGTTFIVYFMRESMLVSSFGVYMRAAYGWAL